MSAARTQAEGEIVTSTDKKLRGLAKKLRGEIEEQTGKNKQEINLIQSDMKVSDEKRDKLAEEFNVVKEAVERLTGDGNKDQNFLHNFFGE